MTMPSSPRSPVTPRSTARYTRYTQNSERSMSPPAVLHNHTQTIPYRRDAQALGESQPSYSPYTSTSFQAQEEMEILKPNRDADETRMSGFNAPPQSRTRPVKDGYMLNMYMALSGMFGFRERYTLMWFFIFGGALLGFCLARSEGLSLSLLKSKMTTWGEFYWFDRSLFRVNYQIHVILSTLGGILVGGQFVPSIRRNMVWLHRINGYVVLLMLIVGNVSGGIISYKAFGGELSVQMAYYLMAVMLIVAGCIGYANVRTNTRRHRKWMLRMVTYFSAVISARLVNVCAREIISRYGTYYSVWRCDEIRYIVSDELVESIHPECFPRDAHAGHYSVAVFASTMWDSSDPLHRLYDASATRVVQGMALWVGLLVNVIGVEIYLHYTDEANYNRTGFELKPKDDHGEPWTY